MTNHPLLYEKTGGIATLRLNRPAARNALSRALVQALIDAVEDARRDSAIRCVLVTGAGLAFCAGGDLKDMHAMTAEEFREYIVLLQRLSAEMRRLAKPSIAAVHGHALAGGFELALSCDIRIADESAVFALPDTAIGLSPTSGMTYLLPRIVGLGRAKHLTMTGDAVDAREAERIGLVTRVVAAGELEQAARELAERIAAHPPLGLRYIKLGYDLAADTDFTTALTFETEAEVRCFDTEECRAFLAAFANRKRGQEPT